MRRFFEKFKLDHSDLPTLLSIVAVLLRITSINIDRDKKRIQWIFHVINIISCGAYFYCYVFSVAWFTFVRCPQTGDYLSAAVGFSLGSCGAASVIKFFYLKLHIDTVTMLVQDYLQCYSLVVGQTRYASNILKYLRVVKRRAKTIWIVVIVNTSIYILLPFVLPGRHLTEDLFVLYGLEPMFESPNFEMANAALILGVYFSFSTLANITVFLVIIIGYIEAQLLALSEELDHLWDDSKQFYNKYKRNMNVFETTYSEAKMRNVFIENRLRDITRFHIMSINLRDRVEKQMRLIYVVEFFFLILGIVAELLGGVKNTNMQIPYTFMQLYIECLSGQRLIDASNVFENSLYGCEWEEFDVNNKKTVFIMFRCSQKTLNMTAGGISVLSFSCLMQVIRTTYSAYTTLQSTIH